jgi:hypothetical protein
MATFDAHRLGYARLRDLEGSVARVLIVNALGEVD